MTHCTHYEERLLDYAELDDATRFIVDAHLATCHQCLQFHRALAEVDSTLTSSFQIQSTLHFNFSALPLQLAIPEKPPLFPLVLEGIGWLSLALIGTVFLQKVAPASIDHRTCIEQPAHGATN